MDRGDMEHVVRVAAAITGHHDFVILEGASLLASVSTPPPELQRASDVTLYPLRDPALGPVVEGCVGELSPFHEHFGYYVRAATAESCTLPARWDARLVTLPIGSPAIATAHCLEPHDLAAAKLASGRDKDLSFATTLLEEKLVDPTVLSERIDQLPLPLDRLRQLKAWLAGTAAPAGQGSRDADFQGPDI